MPAYRFFQLDVFTTQPLAGNPLAVFPDATGVVRPSNGRATIVIEQGLEVRRPSIIHVEIAVTGGAITEVKVGGEAVTVIEGEVRL